MPPAASNMRARARSTRSSTGRALDLVATVIVVGEVGHGEVGKCVVLGHLEQQLTG